MNNTREMTLAEWCERLPSFHLVNRELSALRSQVAELQRQVTHWKANHDHQVEASRVLKERTDMPFERVQCYQSYLELQLKLASYEEAAKQGEYNYVGSVEQYDGELTMKFSDVYSDRLKPGTELYALPPNLPALIEQARKDELQKCWGKINAAIKPGELYGTGCDEVAQRNGLILANNIIMDAIRTRSTKGEG